MLGWGKMPQKVNSFDFRQRFKAIPFRSTCSLSSITALIGRNLHAKDIKKKKTVSSIFSRLMENIPKVKKSNEKVL